MGKPTGSRSAGFAKTLVLDYYECLRQFIYEVLQDIIMETGFFLSIPRLAQLARAGVKESRVDFEMSKRASLSSLRR